MPRRLAQVPDIQRREGIDSPRAYRRFKPGEANPATEAGQIARSRDRNFWLPDESATMESWIEGMTWAIGSKQGGFTYARHDWNTLLIDDQWSAYVLSEKTGSDRLAECLPERSLPFDDIFVDRGERTDCCGSDGSTTARGMPVPSLD